MNFFSEGLFASIRELRMAKKTASQPKRSASQESSISTASTGSAQQRSTRKALNGPMLAPLMYGQHLFDCSASVIYCARHNNFAFVPIGRGKGTWLAYVPLKPTDGWYSAAVSRLKQVLSVGSS